MGVSDVSQPAEAIKIIERARRELLSELNAFYAHIELVDLAPVAEGIEDITKLRVLEALCDEAPQFFRCRRAVSDHSIIDEGNNEFHVRLSEAIEDQRALVLVVIPVGSSAPFKRQRIRPRKIQGYGRFNRVRFVIPQSRWCDGDLLQQFVSSVFETAYGWFEQRVANLISGNRDMLAANLYQYLRAIIPNEEARRNVWFASVTTDCVFRVLDPEGAHAAFALVHPHAHVYAYSTHRLVAEILATALPRQNLLMQAAVTRKQSVDADLSQAVYKRKECIYGSR